MPDLPLASLLQEVNPILTPHPMRPYSLSTLDVHALRLVQEFRHLAHVFRLSSSAFDAGHDPETLCGFTVCGNFDGRSRGVVEDQLSFGRRAAGVVFHDGVVVGVDSIVGILCVDTLGPAFNPERFDLLVFEVIVEVHVATEYIFDGSSVVGLV